MTLLAEKWSDSFVLRCIVTGSMRKKSDMKLGPRWEVSCHGRKVQVVPNPLRDSYKNIESRYKEQLPGADKDNYSGEVANQCVDL
jgi:hypothetical protein